MNITYTLAIPESSAALPLSFAELVNLNEEFSVCEGLGNVIFSSNVGALVSMKNVFVRAVVLFPAVS